MSLTYGTTLVIAKVSLYYKTLPSVPPVGVFFENLLFFQVFSPFPIPLFSRHLPALGFSLPRWRAWSHDLPSNRLYPAQPANEIKKPTSLKQAALIIESKSRHTNTAVTHLLNDWSCVFLVCMDAGMSALWCCLINTAAGLWCLNIHSTTWFIRFSLETLLGLTECSLRLKPPPEVILIPRQNAGGGREKSWWNFIILLCKGNLCDNSDSEESQQTQKMISKTCGTERLVGLVDLCLKLSENYCMSKSLKSQTTHKLHAVNVGLFSLLSCSLPQVR